MPNFLRQKLKSLSLEAGPEQVAAGLAHLPGLVFLDSSSAESMRVTEQRNCAIISARPTRYLSGNILDPKARAVLRKAISKNESSSSPDLGIPLGGLIGWIEYEGEFLFGEYPEMLIFDYSTHQWSEIGSLSDSLKSPSKPTRSNPSESLSFEDSSNREDFCGMVERAISYIASGDIYQVNLSHRFISPWEGNIRDTFALYLKLRQVSPAPFSAYLNLKGRSVLSASPEQFLRISDRTIETRPIKGTRPRFVDREKDEKSAYDLITSPKEISELIMITDLERNDLGQVCEFGSVEATELLKLERFAQVFHLISTVQGKLRPEVDHVEAVHACHPGGSITGAPKKRAREIIAELESIPRGLYTGTIGCFGFNRESLFNIVIRTAICENSKLHFHVGAGIVADSSPEHEWEETLHKAAGILKATS